MRKPFKKTVEDVEKVYTEFIAKNQYTDGIGPYIRKKLQISPDYASGIWFMINRLKEHDLYEKAFNDPKNKPWNQNDVKWIVYSQIPLYERKLADLRRMTINSMETNIKEEFKNKSVDESMLLQAVDDTIRKQIPRLRLECFDISMMKPKPRRTTTAYISTQHNLTSNTET